MNLRNTMLTERSVTQKTYGIIPFIRSSRMGIDGGGRKSRSSSWERGIDTELEKRPRQEAWGNSQVWQRVLWIEVWTKQMWVFAKTYQMVQLRFVHFCVSVSPLKERNSSISQYETRAIGMHTEVFRAKYVDWCQWLTLKCIPEMRWITGCRETNRYTIKRG